MKIKLNSNLFPIISVAMYGTFLEPSSLFDCYQINEDFKDGRINYNSEYYWDRFDNDAYVKHIQRLADKFLTGIKESNGIKVAIKTGDIYSPRFYNFANDEIDLEVAFDKLKVARFAKSNAENFNKFLKEHYSSYDGFCSFTSNNYINWLEDYKQNEDRAIGAILRYIFVELSDEYESEYESFISYVIENTSYSEFITDTVEMDLEIERLNHYVQTNYQTIDIDNFIFDSEILEDETVSRLAKEQFERISNLTLDLFKSA